MVAYPFHLMGVTPKQTLDERQMLWVMDLQVLLTCDCRLRGHEGSRCGTIPPNKGMHLWTRTMPHVCLLTEAFFSSVVLC